MRHGLCVGKSIHRPDQPKFPQTSTLKIRPKKLDTNHNVVVHLTKGSSLLCNINSTVSVQSYRIKAISLEEKRVNGISSKPQNHSNRRSNQSIDSPGDRKPCINPQSTFDTYFTRKTQ